MTTKLGWAENPSIYTGQTSTDGGIVICGPMSAHKANQALVRSVLEEESRLVMYKSWDGQPPVLEIIMMLLNRE